MKTPRKGASAAVVAAAVTAALMQPTTAQAVTDPGTATNTTAKRPDNRPGPLANEVAAKRARALELLTSGKAKLTQRAGGGAVVRVGAASPQDPSAFVEFPREKTDKIWTVLAEYGDQVDKTYGGTPGPEHNQIKEPVRAEDNSTVWEKDFSKAYYDNIFSGDSNESMAGYYKEQSGGRYSVDVTTEDWVTLPHNGAYYGANPREDEGGAWDYVNDAVDTWYAQQKAAGKSDAQIADYLSQFDVWDRYDFDGDGNYNEPDGYIDHFQSVHAGEGEEGNGGADAIWSHRSYVHGDEYGQTGPGLAGDNGEYSLLGGVQIGETGLYVGDYTVEPENGGLGVFAHEFGHDLGLPDFYDTAGGENGTSFWTVMSSGSWMSYGDPTGIGTHANGFGPDEKFFLGWLDYSVAQPDGKAATFKLGPSANTYDGADQAVMVPLEDKEMSAEYTKPYAGAKSWWTGTGDDLANRLTTTEKLPAAKTITVTAKAWYDIEKNYDYLIGQYSTDGIHWKNAGSITGSSNGKWTGIRYSYSPGAASKFRFLYKTDTGVALAGAFLDNIVFKAGNKTVLSDGAEDGSTGFTPKGFKATDGTASRVAPQYYWLENRQYVGADATLENGPYQFSKGYTAPNWVEHFPFQDGLLVWFQDKRQVDNNTIDHNGYGQSLPVDASPAKFSYEGTTAAPSNRRQPFDATFGLDQVDPVCLHREVLVGKGKNQTVQTQQACGPTGRQQRSFNDSDPNRYWSSSNPLNSTKVAGAGVVATVLSEDDGFLTVEVTNPKQ
ncbi:immune inhibitor A domain-containing protein [Nocardioides marmoribigeumensis]|uniref:Immune inhibitor A n=1 Tax=Nocardioides marmoribigeumensis TaxID=433649 RepID=A0ABU2BYA1_9ACTN|nr:immune inhibitor A domain-containing protein [Nocardioides marmoribigeumensis]MDR7363381.1 immune inhibitor A [Nocardioides marmoribigeumensis]